MQRICIMGCLGNKKSESVWMVSLNSLYKAGMDVFGIFSIYTSALISVIAAIYFIFAFLLQIVFSIVLSFWAFDLIGVMTSPLDFFIKIFFDSLIMNVAGFFGLIYLLKNRKNIFSLLNGDYKASEKEMKNSTFYTFFNIILFLIYIALIAIKY